MPPAAQTPSPADPAELQAAYSRARLAWAAAVDLARAAGCFQAPEYLRPDLQARLALAEPLQPDDAAREAA